MAAVVLGLMGAAALALAICGAVSTAAGVIIMFPYVLGLPGWVELPWLVFLLFWAVYVMARNDNK